MERLRRPPMRPGPILRCSLELFLIGIAEILHVRANPEDSIFALLSLHFNVHTTVGSVVANAHVYRLGALVEDAYYIVVHIWINNVSSGRRLNIETRFSERITMNSERGIVAAILQR